MFRLLRTAELIAFDLASNNDNLIGVEVECVDDDDDGNYNLIEIA